MDYLMLEFQVLMRDCGYNHAQLTIPRNLGRL